MYVKQHESISEIVNAVWPTKATNNLVSCVSTAWGAWLMEPPLLDEDGKQVDEVCDLVDFLDLCALPLRYSDDEVTSLASKLIERGRIANTRTLDRKYAPVVDEEGEE